MTQMMETLESRQMFSVSLDTPAPLPVDTSAPAEKATFHPFVITKTIDKSSPAFFAA